MLKYFPFSKTFDTKMGTTPQKDSDLLIDCDEQYHTEVKLKRNLLDTDHGYYYHYLPGYELVAWEVLAKVLREMVRNFPEKFSLAESNGVWSWTNRLLDEEWEFVFGDNDSLPLEPIDWVGRQVQEDLLVLNKEGVLIGGQLCFPSGWSLAEKVGKDFVNIHAPLPGLMAPMVSAANQLMARIPRDRPVKRNNWGIRVCDELDLSSKHTARYQAMLKSTQDWITETIGDRLYVRIEHQTLSRLAQSDAVLFTIHTYLSKLSDELLVETRAQQLRTFLQSVPPDVLNYKQMTPFSDKLTRYLNGVIAH